MLSLRERVARALRARGLSPGERLLVALSGGADSVALLCLLCDLAPELGIGVHAAHLEHGIRGAASLRDATFVRALCEARGVPLRLEHANAPALARERGLGLEEAARYARYAFLERARQETGARYILTAHHREDQAETVLLHLARGAGLSGLRGMRPLEGYILRPLLGEDPAALRAYLREIGQSWREDSSNAREEHARNFVRRKLLPEFARLNTGIVGTLARTAEALSVDEAYLEERLAALGLPRAVPMPYGGLLWAEGLAELHPAMLRRHLIQAMDALALPRPEHRHLLALEALARGEGEAVSLPGGIAASRGPAHLHFITQSVWEPPEAVPLRPDGETPLWQGMRLLARPARPGETGDGAHTQVLRREALRGAVVRTRVAGDRFGAIGQPGRRPLKKALIDLRVDRALRDLWPLVARGDTVLWICGRLPAEEGAVRDAAREAVHLTWSGAPWESPVAGPS